MADNISITDENSQIYCSHIDSLREDMLIRFKDLTELVIPNFVINPFQLIYKLWTYNCKRNSSICRMISNVMPYSPNVDTVHSG